MIFLAVDENEFNKFLNDNPIHKNTLLKWKANYDYKIANKKDGVWKARKQRSDKKRKKMEIASYLLKKENEKISANAIANRAGVNWRTAKKFYDEYRDVLENFDAEFIKDYFDIKLSQNY